MTLGTFWLKYNDDGGVSIGIEDYDIEIFEGGDYETIYTLTPENAKKMEDLLAHTGKQSLKEMVTEEFGVHLNKKSLDGWFKENDIEFELFTWISYD